MVIQANIPLRLRNVSAFSRSSRVSGSEVTSPSCSAQSSERSTANTLTETVPRVATAVCNSDPIALLELHEPELFQNKRILIVDDLPFALARAETIVSERFTESNGCFIETINDPEEAIKMIEKAKSDGNPFDVLVTDLYMQRLLETGTQGINGDELLRRLSNKDLFTPAVVFSGSWAGDIGQSLFSHMDNARSRRELYQVVNQVSDSLGGIPLVQVNKTGLNTKEDLLLSVCGVLLMGSRADRATIREYLEDYKPKALEDTPSREIVSKAVETHRLYKEFLLEVKEEFETQGLQNTYPYMLIAEVLDSKKEWSLNNIGDASSHNARVFFHNELPLMQWIYEHTVVPNAIRENISRDTIDKLEDFYRAMNYYAISTKNKDIRSFDFNSMVDDSVEHLLKHLPYPLHISNELDGTIKLSASPYVVQEIIMQPLTNAFKAVRDKSDGQVNMTIREIAKDETRLDLDGSRFIEVTVEDNGCGMDQNKVEEINEKRCKEGGSTFGTLGWGLTILQDFMSKVDGNYFVESELDKGTKFTIYFRIPDEA